jgi:signal transduction histidine kinase
MAGLRTVRGLLDPLSSATARGGPGTAEAGGSADGLHGATAVLILTALVSGIVTTAFALLPQLHPGYQWHSIRIVVDTSGSLIALFATFLILGRLWRRTYLNELFLVAALAVLAVSTLLFVDVPAVAGWAPDDLTVWGAPLARALAGALFILAAFSPRYETRRIGFRLALTAVGVTTAAGFAILFVHGFVAPWTPEQASQRGDPDLFAFDMLVALVYALGAIGFLRRARRLGDDFYGWLAVGATLGLVSHINYTLSLVLYHRSLTYTGDVFRFAFYAALFVGCLREIWSYWAALSSAAVLEDRRRMARDLHDGLAQELAYISRNLDLVTGAANRDVKARLRSAVERAQTELRAAIGALAPPRSQNVEVALAEAASEVAERFRITLRLDMAPGVQLSPTRTEALIRIACEAITNAAQHSGAKSVTIRLERDGSQVRLRVVDRGCGFDPADRASGFGLIGMRERASSVGGEFRIHSVRGRGSEVDVAV